MTEVEESVLSHELNFATTPKKILVVEIASAIECVAWKMGEESASDLTNVVCGILRGTKLPCPNLDKDEHAAMETLKEAEDITNLPADKGNATVVLDKDQYKKKLMDLLADPVYEKMVTDQTPAIERRILKEV